jgi:hypothetical protein
MNKILICILAIAIPINCMLWLPPDAWVSSSRRTDYENHTIDQEPEPMEVDTPPSSQYEPMETD